MLEIMTLYVNLSIVAYLLVSHALFTMEQGLQKTIQPHFYGKLTHLFFSGPYTGFFAWLVAAFREHLTEILIRFIPVNLSFFVVWLAFGNPGLKGAFTTAIILSLSLGIIEHLEFSNPRFLFALAKRMISALGAAFSALAWIVLLAR